MQLPFKELKFRNIKKEIRIVGIDDCPFIPKSLGKANVLGVVFRGGYWLDGVMHTKVEIDGFDATEKIAQMITSSPHYPQLRIIMLHGITFAGFNIIDIMKLFGLTSIPVIALTREKPNLKKIKKALKNLPYWKERWSIIQGLGAMITLKVGDTHLRMHIAGVSCQDAEKIINISSTRGNIPEPLRLAHLIASDLHDYDNP